MNRVLFLGKTGDQGGQVALATLKKSFDVGSHFGSWGEPLPDGLGFWSGEYIISYLGRWVLPQGIIDRAAVAAINFHPAPPEYPGIGCNNFALYDGAKQYGVTCHLMAAKVDTGPIIKVDRFPIFESDNVERLLERTYVHLAELFQDIVAKIAAGENIEPSGEQWTKKSGTRKALDELATITPDMDQAEVERRIRATSFGQWKPSVQIGGHKFVLAD